jgi:hypothetical protein
MDLLNNYGIELIKLCAQRESVAAALRDRAALWADDFWLAAPDKLAAARLQLRMARLLAPSAAMHWHTSRWRQRSMRPAMPTSCTRWSTRP